MNNKITVLVVEDEDIISKALKTKLEKNDFIIELARNGNDGVEFAKTKKPNIILLDLIMPKMSGFEVLEKLKADPTTKEIPVLILSNLDDSSYIKKARDFGVAEYLVKTKTNLEEIKTKIHEYTKK
ncbi:MAG: response regulator [Patescibacteria group bacterium]|nr:response regulator [Patescibacteria group bacterium]MDD5567499.1 response regulator [Patescibacteria group bacterium]